MRQSAGGLILVFALILLPFTGIASAQDTPMSAGGTVLAEGFNGPMGVLVDDEGMVWVIDSGLGGEEELPWISSEGEEVTATFGQSAQLVRVNPGDGSQEVAAMLTSVAAGMDVIGGAHLALLDGDIYFTIGQGIGDPTLDLPELMGAVARLGEDGAVVEVANLWDFERTVNPDPALFDSHPYGLTAGADGSLYVADAAGNALLRIDPETGDITTVAVFEPVPGVFPRPDRGGEMVTDPVPTGVVADDEGNFYVAFLPGAPFIPGSAKVVKVTPAGEVSDYASGLTMLTDLTMGPDGELYAVQFGIFGEQGPTPNSGAVIHIHAGEGSEPVLEGLSFPTSIDFDDAGNAYVTINGVGAPGSGAVVKFEGVTAAVEHEMTEESAMEGEMAESAEAPAEEAEMAEEGDAMAEDEAMAEGEMAESAEAPAEEEAEMMEEEAAGGEMAEPAEEMAAPEMLPVTGDSLAQEGSSPWLVGTLIFGLIAAGLVLRRRLA